MCLEFIPEEFFIEYDTLMLWEATGTNNSQLPGTNRQPMGSCPMQDFRSDRPALKSLFLGVWAVWPWRSCQTSLRRVLTPIKELESYLLQSRVCKRAASCHSFPLVVCTLGFKQLLCPFESQQKEGFLLLNRKNFLSVFQTSESSHSSSQRMKRG